MIIVSQDGRSIVNFDNVENIDIVADLDGTGEVPYKIYYETKSQRDVLGRYKTQERAKEVLQEIIKTHKISESYKYTRDVGLQSALTADIEMRNLILFRYEMPEK